MRKRIAALLPALVSSTALSFAESPNPFTSNAGASPVSAIPASSAIAALAPLLRTLTDRLTELARAVSQSPSPGPILTLAALALTYGIFHSLGPGHGKTIVSTFFLTKDAKLWQSLLAGALLAFFHALSATTIVLVLYFLIKGVFSASFEDASRIVQIASFGVIALIGAYLLLQKLRGGEHRHLFRLGPRESKDMREDRKVESAQAWRAGLERASSEVTVKGLAGIALAAGAVPCPGASAIILVCLSLKAPFIGALAVAMISVGMGLTVSAIGVIAILAKRGALTASSSWRPQSPGRARRIIEIASAALLFAFGLAFFIAQF